MKKQKGFLLIEILASIIIISIVALAFAKVQTDFLNITKKQHIQRQIDSNLSQWSENLFDRSNTTLNYNFSSLEYYINNFEYNDCNNNNVSVDEQEFNNHVCHIIQHDRNARFLIKPCTGNNLLCINYYSNKYNYDEKMSCKNNVDCYSQPLWGVYLENQILKPLIITP